MVCSYTAQKYGLSKKQKNRGFQKKNSESSGALDQAKMIKQRVEKET